MDYFSIKRFKEVNGSINHKKDCYFDSKEAFSTIG